MLRSLFIANACQLQSIAPSYRNEHNPSFADVTFGNPHCSSSLTFDTAAPETPTRERGGRVKTLVRGYLQRTFDNFFTKFTRRCNLPLTAKHRREAIGNIHYYLTTLHFSFALSQPSFVSCPNLDRPKDVLVQALGSCC